MGNWCPFHHLAFARKLVQDKLWKPNIKHSNSLRLVGDKPIEDILSSFPSPAKSVQKWVVTFSIYAKIWWGYLWSIDLELSKIWYSIYLHLIQHVEWVTIGKQEIYTNTKDISYHIWLLYYALHAFDVIFSHATIEDIQNEEWLKETKIKTIQLASIPDWVQKNMIESISIKELVSENIRSILMRHGVISRNKLRMLKILANVDATKEYRDGKYWICPAVWDGTLDIIFDLLAPIYKLVKLDSNNTV